MTDEGDAIVKPELSKSNFHCPHCGVLSQQIWNGVYHAGGDIVIRDLKISFCQNRECGEYSLWRHETMIYPMKLMAPRARWDMPEDVKKIYEEARKVADISPRAAAALLRVSLEKLTNHLKETKGNLNTRIGNLAKKGLPEKVIRSLDIVRITANEGGTHAGEIDLTGKDGPKVVAKLFWLVNFIVEKTISDPKEIDEMFNKLPEGKKAGLTQRDGK